MPLYRPSDLRDFLTSIGKRPSKSLSQNFLIDGNIVQKILDTCETAKDDLVIEIGPGPGVLTEAILARGIHLVAIEKDTLLSSHLDRLDKDNNLETFNEDFLKFPLKEKLLSSLKNGQQAKVIASPPYHITTPIIRKLITCRGMISHVVLILQEEFVRRIVSKSGNKDYSSFSVFVQSYANAHNMGTISRTCFYPPPKVDSAILLLEMKEPPFSPEQMEQYHQIVRGAFQQRRKKLISSLKKRFDKEVLQKTFIKMGLSEDIRPEQCSLEQFEELFSILSMKE